MTDIITRPVPEDERHEDGDENSRDSASGDASRSGGHSGVYFEDEEPWPEPVDGNELLFHILRVLRRYLVIPSVADIAITLWVAHTYVFRVADVSPILGVVSPVRRCGKSRLLALLDALVQRPLMSSNMTPAVLFRVVEDHQPTLLIDELDTQPYRAELTNLLNSGQHPRGSVIRIDGPGRAPREFSTYCPKAVAQIGELPSTVRDRSIVVEINRRAGTDRKVENLRSGVIHDEFRPMRRRLVRWAQDNVDALAVADPVMPDELHDRAQDNWRQLFAIAALCGPSWVVGAKTAALAMASAGHQDDVSTMLLSDIRSIISEIDADRLPSAELALMLAELQDRPWLDWPRYKGFSTNQLAILLRPFGIKPKPMWRIGRFKKGTTRGYFFADFKQTFDQYLDPIEETGMRGKAGSDTGNKG